MQITKLSRAELEAFAREQYAQQFGRPAPPKVRNAQALVALGEHRPLRWRGHAYRVPPLPFRDGARLLVVSQVLAAEYEEAGGDVWAEVFELAAPSRALARARIMCGDLVQRRRFSRNPFRNATPAEVRDLIAFFLAVPDETPSLRAKGAQTVDLLDGLLEFMRVYPALVNSDGLPVSWQHYQYGLRSLGRCVARESLRFAQAMRMAQTDKESFKGWAAEQASAAGWS